MIARIVDLIKRRPLTPARIDSDRVIDDRAVRVFLSSTFADMQSEREEIVKQIFPQVRRICEDLGIGWSYVDLRWGVAHRSGANRAVRQLAGRKLLR